MASTVFSETTYLGEALSQNGAGPSTDKHTKVFTDARNAPSPALAKRSFLDDTPTLEVLTASQTPFLHAISDKTGGLIGALERLDAELVAAGRNHLLSRKKAWKYVGRRVVQPGTAGLYTTGAEPRIILKPGRYPGLPFGNSIARTWHTDPLVYLSNPVISFGGFSSLQVSGNQAAVVANPANQVFLVKNGGFCALSLNGEYRTLAVVDQVNLKQKVVDPLAANNETRTLGNYEEVFMPTSGKQNYVAATFLDIPANNVVILQKGDELEMLPAGQHAILVPNITIRGFYSTAESQTELRTKDIYTRDQVPVQLTIFIRYKLFDALTLCREGYENPYAALKDKALSCLTQVVSHLDYTALIRQRNFDATEPMMDEGNANEASQAFLDALRTRALDELHEISQHYGISLIDLAVLDRQFKGETARTLDTLTVRALQAQVEATNIDRENANAVKAQEGQLEVARVAAKQRQTEADARAYVTIAEARAAAEAVEIAARARANAVKIEAEADANVTDPQARLTQMARIEVSRVRAYGDKTVFVPDTALGGSVVAGHALAAGMAAGK
ncbi:hypothetical protein JCM8547_007289 [Rhodosporidiobolus lusitaniae]